ncbi:MAG: peptidase M3, partial [Bacteroidia bacterium]
MKKLLPLILIAFIFMISCNDQGTDVNESNPFFTSYNTPFDVPPFDKITVEHFMPAFERGMAEEKEEVEKILSNPDEPTFENTIVAMDQTGLLLARVSSVFFGLSSANTSAALQQVQMDVSPKLAAHGDEINLDPRLFEKIKVVYSNRDKFNLTDEEEFILENTYLGLVRNGADLDPEKKEKLKEMNQELSVLRVKITQNVLAETNSYKLVISEKE